MASPPQPASPKATALDQLHPDAISDLSTKIRVSWILKDLSAVKEVLPEHIETLNDRSQLALLVSFSLSRLGEENRSLFFLTLAADWGQSERSIFDMFTNSLLDDFRDLRSQLASMLLDMNHPTLEFDETLNAQRWIDGGAFESNWDGRTKLLAQMIPAGASVIEFGCGYVTLNRYLPPGCTYVGSDLYARGHGNLVQDFNAPDFHLSEKYSHCVLSGTLEYVKNIFKFLEVISPCVNNIATSYALVEHNRSNRQQWANAFTLIELLDIFHSFGYQCNTIKRWKRQVLIHFSRE